MPRRALESIQLNFIERQSLDLSGNLSSGANDSASFGHTPPSRRVVVFLFFSCWQIVQKSQGLRAAAPDIKLPFKLSTLSQYRISSIRGNGRGGQYGDLVACIPNRDVVRTGWRKRCGGGERGCRLPIDANCISQNFDSTARETG